MTIGEQQYAELIAYWRRWQAAAGGQVPLRSSVTAAEISHLMPNLFLMEVRAPTDLHVLYTGSALDRAMTMQMTGRNFLEFYEPDEWDSFGEGTLLTCGTPCGCRVDRDLVIENGDRFTTSAIVLPLAASGGDIKYLAGLFTMELDAASLPQAPRPRARSYNLQISFFDLGFGAPPPLPIMPVMNESFC